MDAEGRGLDRALTLVAEGRIDEALGLAARELERMGPAMPEAPDESRAALWSVVGLGRQAAEDMDGAAIAFETAIAFAPDKARAIHEQRLRTLVLAVAQSLRASTAAGEGEERVRSLRAALAWIDRGLVAMPRQLELEGAREQASNLLWEAYEHGARALGAAGDTEGARRLAEEALADRAVPAFVAARLNGLLASFLNEEIVHLTANALLTGADARPEETLAALRRVETLLGALPSGALAGDRRLEFHRRLWWGYVRVARRQVDAGEFQAALVPLSRAHALRPAAAAEGRNEARALLVRAVDGLMSTCAEAVVRLAEAGEESRAAAHRERLELALQMATTAGARDDGFDEALRKVEGVLQDVGAPGSG